MEKAAQYIVFIVLSLFTGVVGSIFTIPSIPVWYSNLAKPWFNPPSWLFSPVWTILYILMGSAAFLVWQTKSNKKIKSLKNAAITLYLIQLLLNSLWSYLFFGLKNPSLALAEIVLLLLTISATTYYFWKINRTAAYLMLPYIAWVSFATILNVAIWQLN